MHNFFIATYLKNNYLTIDEILIKRRWYNYYFDNFTIVI